MTDGVIPDTHRKADNGSPRAAAFALDGHFQLIVKTPFIPRFAWPATVHLYG